MPLLDFVVASSLLGALAGAPTPLAPERWFGISFAFCGDVDCDGVEDIAIGSPADGEKEVGAVYTFSISTGRRLSRREGARDARHFGTNVVSVPDVDGDGVPELAVRSGRAENHASGGSIEIWSERGGERLNRFELPTDEMGSGLASVGDVDGDGSSDIATASYLSRSRERVRVLSTRSGECLYQFEGPTDSHGHHPRCFANLGDLDGDGHADLAALAGGQVLFLSPRKGALLRSERYGDLAHAAPAGTAISSIGDFDHDGTTDLLIGHAWPTGRPHMAPGRVQVRSGKDGRMLRTVLAKDLDTLGSDVARAGDVNHDGAEDWWVSDQGHFGGRVALYSGSSGDVLHEAQQPLADGSWLIGWKIEIGPDIDGDGVRDLGASRIRPSGQNARVGQGVALFSGGTGKLMRAIVLKSNQQGDRVIVPD